jgi:hypothetical protein
MSIAWTNIAEFSRPAGPFDRLWLLATETVTGFSHLRLTAEGSWTFPPGSGSECGPDGALGLSLVPTALLAADCAPGCLVGRLGGSSATIAPPPPTQEQLDDGIAVPPSVTGIFAIGCECLYKIPEGVHGPLFVGFNWAARPIEIKTPLKLSIRGAALP